MRLFKMGKTIFCLLLIVAICSCGGTGTNINQYSDDAKEITSFSILGNEGLINGTAIAVTVPYGADLTNLIPTIIYTGESISPESGVEQDFTDPVTYTVTAENGTTKNYTVIATEATDDSKDITDFAILGIHGLIGVDTISLTLPHWTNLSSLTPTISITGTTVSPTSEAEQNFSSPVIYMVTAADGSTKEYTVTVTKASSDAKDITDFNILGLHGTIGTNMISLMVPYGTNPASLTPTITHTGVSVSPASGVSNNFTSPVVYTVTAADGSTKNYTVTVTVALNDAKNITDFSILGVHGVIGSNTIAITVPFGTNLTSLAPIITHTGLSVNPGSGVPRNFTSPVVYTVTAADSSTKNYTVTATISANDRWTRLSGVYGKSTQGFDVATDSSGNVYVTGATNGNLDGETLTAATASFVIKYNSSGVKQWTRLMNGTGAYYGRAITVDYNDDVYVTGSASGSGILDGQTVPGSGGTFIVKYNPSGVKQWIRVLGANGNTVTANAITTDSSGNIYIAGLSTASLDGQILAGSNGAFVVKYDSSGNKLWTRLSSGSGTATATGYGIVADSNDNIYVSGGATGTLDGQAVVGNSAAFLIKYDSSGIKQWTRLSGTSGLTYGGSGAVDSSDNIYFTGWTQGNLDGQTLIGTRGAFIIKYDSSGVKQWTRLSGVTGKETMGGGVVVGSTNNVYLAGWTQGNLDGQTFIGVTYNAFLIQYNTAGVKQWTHLLGTIGCFVEGRSVAVDLNENVYVAGYSYGNLDGQLSSGNSDVFVSSRLTP